MRAERTIVRTEGPVRARVIAIAAAALVLVLAGVAVVVFDSGPAPVPARPATAEPPPAAASVPRAAIQRPQPLAPPAAVAAPGVAEPEPKEITVDQLPRGDGTGIDAFPRPGTKPLQVGLVVPDGYELPPGFVRHYQTTDDGVRLPPILKFHPDHVPAGAPADGVVPPEMAPRDMPQRWLELPAAGKLE